MRGVKDLRSLRYLRCEGLKGLRCEVVRNLRSEGLRCEVPEVCEVLVSECPEV